MKSPYYSRMRALVFLAACTSAAAKPNPQPSPAPVFFRTLGEDEVRLPPVSVAEVKVFRGRPWIQAKCPGTLVFSIDHAVVPMPDEWVERLKVEAAERGCNGIQIGYQSPGLTCEYFETPERIAGYCARCLVMPKKR